MVACSRLRDSGEKSVSIEKCDKRAGAGERQANTVDSGFQVRKSRFFVSDTWIPVSIVGFWIP